MDSVETFRTKDYIFGIHADTPAAGTNEFFSCSGGSGFSSSGSRRQPSMIEIKLTRLIIDLSANAKTQSHTWAVHNNTAATSITALTIPAGLTGVFLSTTFEVDVDIGEVFTFRYLAGADTSNTVTIIGSCTEYSRP